MSVVIDLHYTPHVETIHVTVLLPQFSGSVNGRNLRGKSARSSVIATPDRS